VQEAFRRHTVGQQKLKPPSEASQEQTPFDRLRADLSATRNTFEGDVAKQGVIGKTYDWLKGHAGASASSKSLFEREWSGVLNYDDSSTAIRKNLADTEQKLDRFSENPSATSLVQNLQDEIQTRSDGTVGLKADSLATRYDRSQSAGVNGIADAAVLALSCTKARAVSSILRAGLTGASVKIGLKALDGTYSTPLDDALSGGLIGVALHASRMGRTASDAFVTRMRNNGSISDLERLTGLAVGPRPISMFKSGMEFAPVGALSAISSSYISLRTDGLNRPKAFGHALEDAPNGAAQGFVLGALTGLIRVVRPEGSDSSAPPSLLFNDGDLARFARQAQDGESKMHTPPASPPSSADGENPGSVNDTFTPKPSPEKFSPLDRSVREMSEAEKLSAAKLETTSPAMLDDLSKVPIVDVQKAVASNGNTSSKTLSSLARNPDISVRKAVAGNLNIDSATLRRLVRDANLFVRDAASNTRDFIVLFELRH
jgi:hypothetical protein